MGCWWRAEQAAPQISNWTGPTNNAWTQECGTCADRVQGVRLFVIFNIYLQWISAKIPSTIKDAKKWCGGVIVHSGICKTQRQTWTSKYLKTSFNVVLCDINSTWLERVFCGRQSFFWKGLLQIPQKAAGCLHKCSCLTIFFLMHWIPYTCCLSRNKHMSCVAC